MSKKVNTYIKYEAKEHIKDILVFAFVFTVFLEISEKFFTEIFQTLCLESYKKMKSPTFDNGFEFRRGVFLDVSKGFDKI